MLNLKLFNVYPPTRDWAGLGYRHFMIAWTDRRGYPRSICIRYPRK